MKSALFVWGGWEGHEPEQCAKVFAEVLQGEGYETELTNSMDVYLDAEKLQAADLIVPVVTMSSITKEQLAGLLAAIKSGVGLGGWHGGMADCSVKRPTINLWSAGSGWRIRAA